MVAPRRSGRSRFTLFTLLLLSVTLLTLDARDFAPVERFKDGIAAAVSPFRSLGNTVFSPVGNAWENFSNSDNLEAENQRLRGQVERLLADRIEDAGAAEELAALKSELGLPTNTEYDTVIAEVIAGSISNFDEFVFEINRGSSSGLQDGMPVVTVGGLIGRVEDTRRGTARVRLISDPSVNVGIVILGRDEAGIMTGQGRDELLEVGKGTIRVASEVLVGDVVETRGGDRSLFPPDLAIGTVAEVVVDEGNLEKALKIQPSASLERFDFVTVLLFDPDGAEDGDS